MIKTVTLSGKELKVDKLDGFNAVVHNLSGNTVYASKYPAITPGADNVAEIPAGVAKLISTTNGLVYLLGTGKVELTGQDYEGVNCCPTASIVYGDSTSDATRMYVDEQDALNLKAANNYTDRQINEVNKSVVDLQKIKADKTEIPIVSNPNLLDNWYFADPINQRGKAEYTANTLDTYTIDRWKTVSFVKGSTDVILNKYLTLNFPTSNLSGFSQVIENPELYMGQTLTFSVLTDEDVFSTTVTLVDMETEIDYGDTNINDNLRIDIFYVVKERTLSVRLLSNYNPTSVNVIAAKLELGDKQTLAHKDAGGKWVLNDPPPNKALELAKCQRYYWKSTDVFSFTSNDVKNNNRGLVNVQFPVTMRARPAVTITSMKGTDGYLGDWSTNNDTDIAATVIPSAILTEGFNTINLDNYHTTSSNAFIFCVIADANL